MVISSRGMSTCPHCHDRDRQVKAGRTRTGSQRFQCQLCRRQYTPDPKPLGYDHKTRETALKLYVEGNGIRRIGRLLSVNHQTVANWTRAAHARIAQQSAPALPDAPAVLEADELFTFVASKKARRMSSPSSIARRG